MAKLPKHMARLKASSIACAKHLMLTEGLSIDEAQDRVLKFMDENEDNLISKDNELAIAAMEMIFIGE